MDNDNIEIIDDGNNNIEILDDNNGNNNIEILETSNNKKNNNKIGIVFSISAIVMFLLSIFINLGLISTLAFIILGIIFSIIGIIKSKKYFKIIGIIALIINIIPIIISLIFTNTIWPSVKNNMLNQTYCSTAVQCSDCNENTCKCRYYEDNGVLSNNTIECDASSVNKSNNDSAIWQSIKDNVRNQTYCSSAVQCNDCNGQTCKCKYYEDNGVLSNNIIECEDRSSNNKSVGNNEISKISMDIKVDDNGNAYITEVWNATIYKGTEGYHPYFNLGNSFINNFTVTDDSGTTYTYNNNWVLSNSFEQKKYTNGIYQKGHEVDLCWGISEYGKRTYTLKYTINNFIYNTTDGVQILFWQLIPYDMNPKPNDVYIKIYGSKTFEDTLEVWGYGNYGGSTRIYNGYIEMKSPSNGLKSSDNMTILAKFPQGYFNTTNKINKSFDEVFSGAEVGTTRP